jgi:hypothetical protein
MIIATSITEPYLEKSRPFFESVNKYFIGKRICFTIGFTTEIEGWETVTVPIEALACQWQPQNRKDFYCLQHGEFVNFYPFKEDDTIMFCDSDMILQREWDVKINFDKDSFYVTQCSFPPTTLWNVVDNLGGTREVINKYSIGEDEKEFCTCLLIANAAAWRVLKNRARINKEFLYHFKHHAALQLLINMFVLATFKLEILPYKICCADWYTGTPANYVGDSLFHGRELVYFDHTKFNK